MNAVETTKIFAVLEAVYPEFGRKLSDDEYDGILALWGELFSEPYEVVSNAVKAFIATDQRGFAPKPGQIKAEIRKLYAEDKMTEAEAVNMVMCAVRNSAYNSAEEYKKLPRELQRLVGSPMQLREWALSDQQAINTVVSSNLQRAYGKIAERQAELEALPENIKQHMRLAATSSMFLIDGGSTGL